MWTLVSPKADGYAKPASRCCRRGAGKEGNTVLKCSHFSLLEANEVPRFCFLFLLF